jgi:hypothetical protein
MDGDLQTSLSCTVEVKVAQGRYAHKAFREAWSPELPVAYPLG